MKTSWQIVIGLEIHIQMQTERKLFATEASGFSDNPNSQISVITWAHPGVLPQLNEKAVKLAVRMGLATHCEIDQVCRFARKHYFYPDSPKGYQRTQSDQPICKEGYLDIKTGDEWKRIGIERIHMEEDAGKSIHDQDPSSSFVDLNRAGTPLLELVTRPELRSIDEAVAFLAEIRRIARYHGVSDGDMEKGNLRCDANISLRKSDSDPLGTRVEVKNLNSFSFLQKAILFEVNRQSYLLERGLSVTQETRAFDSRNGTTLSMRNKEDAQDYRYLTEPDLPALSIPDEWLEAEKKHLVELPLTRLKRYTEEHGLGEAEATALIEQIGMTNYLEAMIAAAAAPKSAANWLLGPVSALMDHESWETLSVAPSAMAELVSLIDQGAVSHHDGKDKLLPALLAAPGSSPDQLADKMGLRLVSQAGKIETIMQAVMDANPDEVKRYRGGKKGLQGFFVGKVMRELRGGADPKEVNQVVQKMLGEG